jgi:hypothetical protein
MKKAQIFSPCNKYNLQNSPLKERNQNPSRYYYNSVTKFLKLKLLYSRMNLSTISLPTKAKANKEKTEGKDPRTLQSQNGAADLFALLVLVVSTTFFSCFFFFFFFCACIGREGSRE